MEVICMSIQLVIKFFLSLNIAMCHAFVSVVFLPDGVNTKYAIHALLFKYFSNYLFPSSKLEFYFISYNSFLFGGQRSPNMDGFSILAEIG